LVSLYYFIEPFASVTYKSNSSTTMLHLGSDRGQDSEGPEMLTQGFTHSFSMTFDKKEDYAAFQSHPNHVEYSATFSAAIEKIVVLCFPSVRVKPSA